jgi:hypothetical protein
MSGADRIIRWSTALAVLGVAAVAAVASYEHAYDLVRMHGESGWTARMVPLTVEGLIYASSMVMLDSARRRMLVPVLGAVAPRPGHRGDARGQRRAWSGPWPSRCSGGSLAGGRAGWLLRAPHDGDPEFPGSAGKHAPGRARGGPVAEPGGSAVCRAASGGSGSLGACDPRSATCWPASGTKAARLPRCGSGKEGGKSGCVSNLRWRASNRLGLGGVPGVPLLQAGPPRQPSARLAQCRKCRRISHETKVVSFALVARRVASGVSGDGVSCVLAQFYMSVPCGPVS